MINFNKLNPMLRDFSNLYDEAGTEMIRNVTDRIYADADLTDQEWIEVKINESEEMQQENEEIISETREQSNVDIAALITFAFILGIDSVNKDLDNTEGHQSTIDNNQALLNRYITNARTDTSQMQRRMLNNAAEKYGLCIKDVNDAVNQAIIEGTTVSRRDITERILNEWAREGIDGFTDTRGRKMSAESYAELIARTDGVNIANDGVQIRAKELDQNLLLVSQHSDESRLCRPFSNKVYSIEQQQGYTQLEDVKFFNRGDGLGLFHHNCRHYTSIYVKGTKKPDSIPNQERVFENKLNNEQRYIERQIRRYKRLSITSVDKKDFYRKKLGEWNYAYDTFTRQAERTPRKTRLSVKGTRVKPIEPSAKEKQFLDNKYSTRINNFK